MRLFLTFIFFASGLTGLVYQVLWMRKFSTILGTSYLAVSVVVAAFMLGLYLGAKWIGKRIDSIYNELKWYAVLEAIIGIYALALFVLLPLSEKIYVSIFQFTAQNSFLGVLLTSLLTILVLLIPTSAMGATLPLIVRHVTNRLSNFKNQISHFYGINTLGGAIGALLAGFILIEKIGTDASIIVVAVLNLLIALLIWMKSNSIKSSNAEVRSIEMKAPENNRVSEKTSALLIIAFLSGFCALAYEILWTRSLKIIIQSSTYSFAIMLFVFLLGIGLGSYLAKNRFKKNKLFVYGIMQISLAVYALLTIAFLYKWFYTDFFQKQILEMVYDFSFHWFWGIFAYVILSLFLFFIPTLLMGFMFPILNDLYHTQNPQDAGKTVSQVYSVNTVGSILGSLGAGIFLLPLIGIKASILLIVFINLLIGVYFVSKSNKPKKWLAVLATVPILAVGLFASLQGTYLRSNQEAKTDQVKFYDEGLMSTVKVYEKRNELIMSIDGTKIASTEQSLLQKEKMIGHLPFFLSKDLKNVLAVGLASGISVDAMAKHQEVQNIDCVELIKPVFEAAKLFKSYNGDLLSNEKVHFYENDIYAFLKFQDKKYDLISSDGKLGSTNKANTVMLSSDYYEVCKQSLNENGLFIQWIPITTPSSAFELITQTLKASFSHVELFYFYPSDVFMVASQKPIRLDFERMQQVFNETDVQNDLRLIDVNKASNVLSAYSGPFTQSVPNDKVLNSFNQPLLEFWYLRDWKKSKNYEGGFRAKNMQFLLDNFMENKSIAVGKYQKLPNPQFAYGIYNTAQNFFEFSVLNFKQGNYQKGKEQYDLYRSSIPF